MTAESHRMAEEKGLRPELSHRQATWNGNECPLIPMAAITGTPSREFLYERLKNWRSCGVSQFLIYPRRGLDIEYMSAAWLDRCEWICEDAASLGFTSIWLYDEKNWPSGTCNGEVIGKNPDHAIQVLCVSESRPGEYEFHLRRGTRMADLLNPEAVDSFIRLTHERYEKRLGRFFGNLIKGFFTDEPDIAYFGDLYDEGYVRLLPYYDGVEEDYRRLTGGSLREDVLRGLKIGNDFWQGPFNRLMAKRFKAVFSERISRWCADRGMVLTGHLMNEYCSFTALHGSGHILEVLSGFSLPGIDDTFTPLDNERMEYLTYSSGMYAIEKRGNRGGMAELFALGPCDMTLEWMCTHIFFCAAFGIDHYLMAVSQTEVRGNAGLPRHFNQFSESQPWFEAIRELGEYAREAARWAGKERDCDVAVRYPYEPRPLTDLLQHLADAQLNWKLVLPGEETDAPIVLSCEDGVLQEERSGDFFFDFGTWDRKFLSKYSRKMEVREGDGSLAHGIFLRTFRDNCALVVNLSGRERDLFLKTAEKTIPFRLYPTGVFTWDPTSETEKQPGSIFDLPRNGWEITLDSPNIMRAEFEADKFEFALAEELRLRLVLRNYGDPVEVLLDGREIEASSPCRSLVQGFREIYRESSDLRLSKGKHLLTLRRKTTIYPYLPAAFLVGDFAAAPGGTFSRYRNDGVGLSGYVGKIRLKQEVEIPAGTTAIQADTLGLAAELSLNGASLGRRICDPFRWANPGVSGKVRAELTIFTSCGRLFGEKVFFDAPDWLKDWRPRQPPEWLKEWRPRNDKPLLFYGGPVSRGKRQ